MCSGILQTLSMCTVQYVKFQRLFLQNIPSCEMKKCDRPVWFIKDMSVRPMAFQKEYRLSLLDLP